MNEDQLRRRIEQVRCGRLSRRAFVAWLGALGVPAPMAGFLLLDAGVARADTPAFVKGCRTPARVYGNASFAWV